MHIRCIQCSATYDLHERVLACSRCGDLLEIVVQVKRAPEELKRTWRERRMSNAACDLSGVWRFREFLPGGYDQESPWRRATRPWSRPGAARPGPAWKTFSTNIWDGILPPASKTLV